VAGAGRQLVAAAGSVTVALNRRTTAGTGVPVVLLPGLGDTVSTWDVFASSLSAPTVALDLRGHGASPWPGEYTVDAMADDVLAALADLPVVDIVGHSMGGHVASVVAMRAPDGVRRLVLEDAPVPPRAGPPVPDANPPDRPPEPIDYDWAMVAVLRRAVRATNPAWWQGISRLAVPTLWLSGGPSSHLPPAHVASAVEAMPHASMRTIPVGHLIHEAAPEEFARVVVPFLEES
jgi:pimeloyl-ACP methyl ester carboxylesterase